jgi:hypothetical protein
VVVEIFNRVNSGGTKLSKGDLALARLCAQWPEARQEMKRQLSDWAQAGYQFELDWLLRNVTTVVTGQARFAQLSDVDTPTFKAGLVRAEAAVNKLLNLIANRLGLDHGRVLGGRYAFPVLTRFLDEHGLRSAAEQDRLLYWYVHSFLWGRFTGSTETVLNQDLASVVERLNPLDRLIDGLRRWRGDLTVRASDFGGWSLGARFYPMLYLLTRTHSSRDLAAGGGPLHAALLGRMSRLEVHHIFPRALLYRAGYGRPEVNAIANFCFLTKEANLEILDRAPEDYFEQTMARYPGALESQWIPTDRSLWQVERYRDFLEARREMLAEAANRFLDSLLHAEPVAEPLPLSTELTPRAPAEILEAILPEVAALTRWASERGYAEPAFEFEINDPATGEFIVVGDAVWPLGVQEELTEPICLEIDADAETITRLTAIGYRCFTAIEALKRYAEGVSAAASEPSVEWGRAEAVP